jgi:branched-chain amino acid transport system permease protein
MTWDAWQAIILTTLLLGSLYVLMSTGLALVWGTLRIFNFAHGSLLMLGAYLAWTISQPEALNWGLAVGIVVAILLMGGVGILLEQSLVAPFLKRPNAALIAIITTLSGAIFLENLALIIWGPRIKQLPPMIEGSVSILGTKVASQEIVMMALAPILLLGLWLVLKLTKVGLAIRGVEQNRSSALLMGVNVAWVYAFTFAVSAGFAAIAGIMLGSTRFIQPAMGNGPLLKAFIVIILGGLGSLGGTVVGAYLIALIEAISMTYLGLYWTPLLLFLVMILTLVFKPSGLFGLKEG